MNFRSPTLLALILFLLIPGVHPASADVGPPANPPGHNIEPGSTIPTAVRMVDERVVIDIHSPDELPESEWGDYARVTATFYMRNVGSQAEYMDVRFPLEDESVLMSGSPIEDFQASVNGKKAEITYASEPFPHPAYGDMLFNWAKFPVNFPPGEIVTIEVTYRLLPSFGGADGQVYNYILITGKDWQGTIGRAEIIVNFPYDISAENLFQRPKDSQVVGRQLTWIKSDFEPGEADNFTINIMPPSMWIHLAEAREAVQSHPSNAQSWNELGNAYLLLAQNINREVFQEIYKPQKNDWYVEQGLIAYRKAAELAPSSRRPHIGIAYLLLAKYLPHVPADQAEVIREELTTAATLPEAADPETARADAELFYSVSWSFGFYAGEFLATASPTPKNTNPPRPTLTAAPTASVTPTPTAATRPTQEAQVSETPTAIVPTGISGQAAQRSQPGWLIPGLISVVMLLALGLWVGVFARRLHNTSTHK